MNGTEERPLTAQLTTAQVVLAQFTEQLAEWKHMAPAKRRTTWTERVADLEARIAAETPEAE